MKEKVFYWMPVKAVCPTCGKEAYGESGAEINPNQLNEALAMASLTPLVCPGCLLPVPNTVRREVHPQIVSEEKFRSRNLKIERKMSVTPIPDEVN